MALFCSVVYAIIDLHIFQRNGGFNPKVCGIAYLEKERTQCVILYHMDVAGITVA